MILLALALASVQQSDAEYWAEHCKLPGAWVHRECPRTPSVAWQVFTVNRSGKVERSPFIDRDYHECLRNLDQIDLRNVSRAGCERAR